MKYLLCLSHKYFKFYNLKIIGLSIFISLFSSCFYSAKYAARYTVQNNTNTNDYRTITINFINQLANKNKLSPDTKFNGIDTLAYFGQPYHYFKFWFEEKDSISILVLDYKGTFGSKKNKPYKELFTELHTFMKGNFIILEEDIKEENNSKH
jgi:hypothetical protein